VLPLDDVPAVTPVDVPVDEPVVVDDVVDESGIGLTVAGADVAAKTLDADDKITADAAQITNNFFLIEFFILLYPLYIFYF
jgi:hypothetical protein